ncbi:MAG: putative transporter related protein [Firmicutes bacterium]|nr:putative transporter related protein [Bacillota bacterium]
MKKWIVFILVLCITLTLAGCAGGNESAKSNAGSTAEQSGRIPVQGMLSMLDFEKAQAASFQRTPPYTSLEFGKYERKGYPALSELLLALNSSQVDWAYIPFDTAKYVQAANKDWTLVVDTSVIFSYSMATRSEDQALAEQLSNAITTMRGDGTLDALEKEYIYSANGAPNTENLKMPVFAGAPTIRIGLTGNLPPFDYTNADGAPRGFNVAFAKALSEKLGVNIELVVTDVGARLLALSSKKIDVVFWMIINDYSGTKAVADGLRITPSYHKSYGAALTKDYPYEQILERYGLLTKGKK